MDFATSGPWLIAAYVACLGLNALLIGLGKSGFGGGLGLLGVALMSLVASPQQMLGLLLPMVLVGDAIAVMQHRAQANPAMLKRTVPGGLVGLGLGAGMLVGLMQLSPDVLERALAGAIGMICLGLITGLMVRRWRGHAVALRCSGRRDFGVGLASSVLGVLAQAGGPLMTLYVAATQDSGRRIAATLAVFFFAMNLAKTPLYVATGILDLATLWHSLLALPLLVAGSIAGFWLNRRIRLEPFQLIVYGLTALSAVGLIVKAIV